MSAPMDLWRCTGCHYIYDPAAGDPGHGVAPGTAFEDLPSSWRCPECGAPQDMFQRMNTPTRPI